MKLGDAAKATNYEELLKTIDDLKMDNFVAQGSYVTHGLDEVIRNFKNGRSDSNKALLSITDGYNHPSVTVREIQDKTKVINDMNISLHAIGRTHMLKYSIKL